MGYRHSQLHAIPTFWLILLQMLTSGQTASVIPDNSVIWTARDNGFHYFNPNDTVKWLFDQNPAGLLLRKVNVASTNAIFGMSYDYSTDQIIVSDPGVNFISLINMELKAGTPFHIGTSSGVGQLTIDWLARNVYWTDAGYGWIAMKSFPSVTGHVNSLDKKFRTIVDTFLDKPTGIIVYPQHHYLFWADAGERPKIERSDLVGDNRTVLVYQGLISPTCLSVDNETNRLFWSDPVRSTLEYINFDGTGRTVFVSEGGYDFYGIAVFQDRLIFTAPMKNVTGVYSLKNAFPGMLLDVGRPLYYVDVYDKDSQPRNPLEPCDSSLFDCEQICVHMKDDRGATCFCEDGFDLVGGNQCKANTTVLERHILFTRKTSICATSINTIYSSFGVSPDCSVIQHTSAITRFAIDMKDDYIFFTDGTGLYKQLAFSATPALLYTSNSTIKDLDYDWKIRKLYWAEDGNDRLLFKTTEDLTITPELSPVYQSTSLTITSLAVDPHNNHVYWIARGDDSTFKLYDWNRGDNTVRQIVTSSLSNPTDIEYDRSNDRLLWNDDRYYGIIRPDGTGVQRVDTLPDLGVRHGIAVYKKLVICTILDNVNHFDVFVDGVTPPLSVHVSQVLLNETILDVHVFDSTTQLEYLDPCDVDNNGCQHLCFPGDVPQCACNLGYELEADGKSCSSNVLSENFSLVLDGLYGRVFQFQTNIRPVNLKIIQIAPSNRPVAMTFDDARNTLTWVDGVSKSIRKININILQGVETTISGSDFLETSVIAVDLLSGNTYVTKERKVYVIDKHDQQQTILDENQVQSTIKSIALSADKGKLTWIEAGSQARIMRSNTNGSSVQTVVAYTSDRIASPEVIKFDPSNGDYIYWCDSVKDKIERVDNNLVATIIYQKAYHYPVAFDVDERYLYFIPREQRNIFTIDKITGQEVAVVMETPIVGALFSIHVSRPVSLPTTVVPAVTPAPSEDSNIPIIPIAAGAGGGLLVLIIVIIIAVRLTRKRNEKTAMRRPSNLPAKIDVDGSRRNHGYDGFGSLSPVPPPRSNQGIPPSSRNHDYESTYTDLGGPSPDPPVRPQNLPEEEEYDYLDEGKMVVELQTKKEEDYNSRDVPRNSGRYSTFPVITDYDKSYLRPIGNKDPDYQAYLDPIPKADYPIYPSTTTSISESQYDNRPNLVGHESNDYMSSISGSNRKIGPQDGAVINPSPYNTKIIYDGNPSKLPDDYLEPMRLSTRSDNKLPTGQVQGRRSAHDSFQPVARYGHTGSLHQSHDYREFGDPYRSNRGRLSRTLDDNNGHSRAPSSRSSRSSVVSERMADVAAGGRHSSRSGSARTSRYNTGLIKRF